MNLINTLTRIIPLAIGLIGAVEKMFGAKAGSGEEKKEAYLNGLMTALGITEAILNKDIVNDAKFRELAGKLADAVVAINNFIRDFKSKDEQ